ncbi:MAG: hypothetical protein LBK61_10205 [Spirochaetaceae bacterium]|nr:hypothetical protein [Spirochaetaceae bacterium]
MIHKKFLAGMSALVLSASLFFLGCPDGNDGETDDTGTPVGSLADLVGTWVGGNSGGGGGGGGSTDGKLIVKVTDAQGAGTIAKGSGTAADCTYAVPSAGTLTVTYTGDPPPSAETYTAAINDAGALLLTKDGTTWTLTFRTGGGGGGNG